MEEDLLKQKRLLENLTASRFNPEPVARHICREARVANLTQLASRPNGVFGHMPDAWSLMKERTIGVEVGSVRQPNGAPNPVFRFRLNQSGEAQRVRCPLDETCRFLDPPQLPSASQWVHPYTQRAVSGDLERVALYSCVARHRWSSFPIHVDVRMGHIPRGVDSIQQQSALDKMYRAAGSTESAFMSISRTTDEGLEVDNTPIVATPFGVTNAAFVRTMALVNCSNLENGVVRIPHEVCVEARLPVYTGPPTPDEDQLTRLLERFRLEDTPEERERLTSTLRTEWDAHTKDQETSSCFYAVPVMHVLAWPFHSPDYAQQHKVRAEMLRFVNGGEPVALYYLVNEVWYKSMVRDFCDEEVGWLNKVDVRPLRDIAFEFVPFTDTARYPALQEKEEVEGVVAVRAHLTYALPPVGLTAEAVRTLAPTLAPGFLGAQNYVDDETMRELAIQRHLQK